MNGKNVAFWLLYLVVGVWAQRFVPGVDMLAPGILVSLQEKRTTQTLWLLLILVLIQEGTGTFVFGAAILWYVSMLIIYFAGRWMFETENFLFISLLGLCFGGAHLVIVNAMQILQELGEIRRTLPLESLIQAFVFPLLWLAVRQLRKGWAFHATTV